MAACRMATNPVSGSISSSSSSSTLTAPPPTSPRNVPRTRDRPKLPLTPLGQSFTFGLKAPPGIEFTTQALPLQNGLQRIRTMSSSSAVVGPRTRRGHHHKHSLSHNFFSFLDPGTTAASTTTTSSCAQEARKDGKEEGKAVLHTQPTPVPVSQWDAGCSPHSAVNGHLNAHSHFPAHYHDHFQYRQRTSTFFRRGASLFQLVLGATLWVRSQQVGSIACTGIGYWVVFDAIGVFLGGRRENSRSRLPAGGNQKKDLERIRQPYGAARLLTVLTFAQAIYLMFSAVYVCKETVEHLLLSASGPGEDGHHHHAGDGDGIDFPVFTTSLSFISIFVMAYYLNNNSRIFAVTNNRIPSISTSFRRFISLASTAATSTFFYPASFTPPPPLPKSRLGYVLSNPFVACPLWFGGAVVCVGLFVNQIHHRVADLLIASLLSLATFRVAYQTCIVLGSVLLQTAPPRGAPGGKMEEFLRVMRELESHPHVVHLPAPRLWQLSPQLAFSPVPFPSSWCPLGIIRLVLDHDRCSSEQLSPVLLPPPSSTAMQKLPSPKLVATVQIHVPRDLPDEDVLALTTFAWERCMRALLGDGFVSDIGMQKKCEAECEDKDEGEEVHEGIPEVTVGIVRG